MSSPEQISKLRKRGWKQLAKAAKCCSCGKEFEWWQSPRRKLIPLDADTLDFHWVKCRNAFRNKMPPTGPPAHFKWPYGYR